MGSLGSQERSRPELTAELDLITFIKEEKLAFLAGEGWQFPDFLGNLDYSKGLRVLEQAKRFGAEVDFEDYDGFPGQSRVVLAADRVLRALCFADERVRAAVHDRYQGEMKMREPDDYQLPSWAPPELLELTLLTEADLAPKQLSFLNS